MAIFSELNYLKKKKNNIDFFRDSFIMNVINSNQDDLLINDIY